MLALIKMGSFVFCRSFSRQEELHEYIILVQMALYPDVDSWRKMKLILQAMWPTGTSAYFRFLWHEMTQTISTQQNRIQVCGMVNCQLVITPLINKFDIR